MNVGILKITPKKETKKDWRILRFNEASVGFYSFAKRVMKQCGKYLCTRFLPFLPLSYPINSQSRWPLNNFLLSCCYSLAHYRNSFMRSFCDKLISFLCLLKKGNQFWNNKSLKEWPLEKRRLSTRDRDII